ncbi:MAG: RHS repeat-associated core domain-containing protein [Gemmatimonadetes bacterium]|nr:RHS repeat-associated core domain-containing protein [Gemmatimonadota bacterium]
MGSLILEQADASGLLYRRNRYYDPASGRFTQMDPIGLAGGLNLYGFAGGDPVNFSDPFGLCPDPEDGWCRLFEAGMAGLGATVGLIAGGGVGLGATVLSGGALAAPAVAATAATTALGAAYGLAAGRALSNVLFSKSGREQEPGQQYEEISEAQQRVRRQGQPDKINSIKKSKQRDRVQIRDEAEEALGALRERP